MIRTPRDSHLQDNFDQRTNQLKRKAYSSIETEIEIQERQSLESVPSSFDKVNSLGLECSTSRTPFQIYENRKLIQRADAAAYACPALGGTAMHDVIPRRGRALGQYTPVLPVLWFQWDVFAWPAPPE